MHSLHALRGIAVVTTVCLGTCPGAAIGDFTLNLKVQAGRREQTVASGKPNIPLPVFPAKVMDVVSVQWSAVNGVRNLTLSDVTLHVFMDRASGSANVKPSAKALYESAVIVDFEPGAKSIGEFRMPMPEAGKYLVRVETIGAAKKVGREVVAEMQVSVQ
jgi:hypothetical protein